MIRGSRSGKRIEITAGIIILLMLFVVLFSSFYIASETDHECEGERCSVCECIEQCEAVLGHISSCGLIVLAAASAVILVCAVLFSGREVLSASTPVSMKIRLNN